MSVWWTARASCLIIIHCYSNRNYLTSAYENRNNRVLFYCCSWCDCGQLWRCGVQVTIWPWVTHWKYETEGGGGPSAWLWGQLAAGRRYGASGRAGGLKTLQTGCSLSWTKSCLVSLFASHRSTYVQSWLVTVVFWVVLCVFLKEMCSCISCPRQAST